MTNRRDRFRKQLNGLYLPYYDALCNELPDLWQPYCGWRAPDEQDRLYDLKNGTTGAKAWESPHQYGCASDWTIWEDGAPLWPKADDKIWQQYQNACLKVGLRWGGDFGDCDHNELQLKVSWKQVAKVRDLSGPDAAMEFVELHQVK